MALYLKNMYLYLIILMASHVLALQANPPHMESETHKEVDSWLAPCSTSHPAPGKSNGGYSKKVGLCTHVGNLEGALCCQRGTRCNDHLGSETKAGISLYFSLPVILSLYFFFQV